MDLIDENDNIIGKIDVEEIHDKGILHRTTHTFIINSEGKLFCRKISSKNKIYSGYWSTSVGAHVFSDQNYDQVAEESLRTNLGINCHLEMIGKVRVHDKYENEISATYVGYSNEKIHILNSDIEDGRFFTIDEIKELTKKHNVTPHLIISLKLYLETRK